MLASWQYRLVCPRTRPKNEGEGEKKREVNGDPSSGHQRAARHPEIHPPLKEENKGR